MIVLIGGILIKGRGIIIRLIWMNAILNLSNISYYVLNKHIVS